MNVAFTALTLVSLVLMTVTAPADALPAMIRGVSDAVLLLLKLTAIYAVWIAVLKMAERSGMSRALSRALRPVTRRLFKERARKATTSSPSTSRPICWGWAERALPPP